MASDEDRLYTLSGSSTPIFRRPRAPSLVQKVLRGRLGVDTSPHIPPGQNTALTEDHSDCAAPLQAERMQEEGQPITAPTVESYLDKESVESHSSSSISPLVENRNRSNRKTSRNYIKLSAPREAIERAKLDTPNPQRFEKKRLRRQQMEAARVEAAELNSCRDPHFNVEEEINNSESGKLNFSLQLQRLDDLGENDDEGPYERTLSENILSPCSPKHPRPTADSEPNLFDFESQIEEAEDSGFDKPFPKKLRSTGRRKQETEVRDAVLQGLQGQSHRKTTMKGKKSKPQRKKKQPRRVPADELVLVAEKFSSSDLDVIAVISRELPQDPISQLSQNEDPVGFLEPNRVKSFRKIMTNKPVSKGFGTIDISAFRMPKVPNTSQHILEDSRCQRQNMRPYSDGFEGHEAQPIGRPMQVRELNRRQPALHKMTVRIGELTLVAEKRLVEDYQELQSHQYKRHHSRRGKPDLDGQLKRVDTHKTRRCGGEPMMVDKAQNQAVGEDDLPKRTPDGSEADMLENPTPMITSGSHSISPLKHKGKAEGRVASRDEVNVQQLRKASNLNGSFFKRYESDTIDGSQQSKMVTTSRGSALSQLKKEEIKIIQQLMMVSIPRSLVETEDSEEESAQETDSGEGSNSELEWGYEEVRSETQEEGTGEDGDSLPESATGVQGEEMVGSEGWNGVAVFCDDRSGLEHSPPKKIPQGIEVRIPSTKIRAGHSPCKNVDFPRSFARNIISHGRSMFIQEVKPADPNPFSQSCPSRNLGQAAKQITRPDELWFDSINNEHHHNYGNWQTNPPKRSTLIGHQDDENSWRPRRPIPSNTAMEVDDDDIANSPSSVRSQNYSLAQSGESAIRRLSKVAGLKLKMATSLPSSPQHKLPHDSQGSIELGDSQRFVRRSPSLCVPETQYQLEEVEEEDQDNEQDQAEQADLETPTPQESFILTNSYFPRASQQLQEPVRKLNFVRIQSTPSYTYTTRPESGMMAGSISMSTVFKHSMSPVKSAISQISKVIASGPGQEMTLKTQTRQASLEMGTLPSIGRRRGMVSLSFMPPFTQK